MTVGAMKAKKLSIDCNEGEGYGGDEGAVGDGSDEVANQVDDNEGGGDCGDDVDDDDKVVSAFSAAMVAAVTTQPLDMIKTQLKIRNSKGSASLLSLAKELPSMPGLYTGLRSMLSAAFDMLKLVSRNDYQI